MDEYDSYRPERGLSVAEPAAEFVAIRDNTLAKPNSWPLLPISTIANITIANIETETVAHNIMGKLRVRSWLQYIDIHTQFELRKVKQS